MSFLLPGRSVLAFQPKPIILLNPYYRLGRRMSIRKYLLPSYRPPCMIVQRIAPFVGEWNAFVTGHVGRTFGKMHVLWVNVRIGMAYQPVPLRADFSDVG